CDLFCRENRYARCGQLKGEWNAIETATDLGNGGCVLFCQIEFWIRRPRSFYKQLNRLKSRQHLIRSGSLIRQPKRRHTIDSFSADAQSLATACDDLDVWRVVQKIICELRAGFNEMFAVVEDQQKIFTAQKILDDIYQRHAH